jgi:hypothetical protein
VPLGTAGLAAPTPLKEIDSTGSHGHAQNACIELRARRHHRRRSGSRQAQKKKDAAEYFQRSLPGNVF